MGRKWASIGSILFHVVILILVLRMDQKLETITKEVKIDLKVIHSQVNEITRIVNSGVKVNYTEKDLYCLTKNIYYEAGVEDKLGKVAVAQITVNRLKLEYWGNTICKVVYAPAQFSWTLKEKLPKPNPQLWAESKAIAIDVLHGDRINGLTKSLFYHADYIRDPHWVDKKEKVTQIGKHIFYNKAKNSWLQLESS